MPNGSNPPGPPDDPNDRDWRGEARRRYPHSVNPVASMLQHQENRMLSVIELIEAWGMIDGAHHKQWVLDHVLREILLENYDEWVINYNSNPDYDNWDTGIAP